MINFWVKHAGNRNNIIQKGDLSAHINLETLSDIVYLYAIGPIEGLKGEITVYNGKSSIATIEREQPKIYSSLNYNAIFLAYASASQWKHIPIEKSISGLSNVEAFIQTMAKKHNVDTQKPFPFRIEGIVDSLNYHIIFKSDNAPHNKTEHQRAKQKFSVYKSRVLIIGFWTDIESQGVYTHPDMRTHLHFMLEDDTESGHVDNIQMREGAFLYLPL
jgi:acetolactate decarboxylase